jgi:TPP-dependent pyruvate/acetoin dehydrogenase alpha subunit
MAGKVGQATAAAAVSTGGSLISDAKLKQLYTTMVHCRLLAERVRRLRGLPPSTALYSASAGQEAIATGLAIDLQPEDTIALPPRNAIAGLVRGVALGEIASQIYAPIAANGHPAYIIPSAASQCTQLELATSAARINKKKKRKSVVVVFANKATASSPSWREALKLAGRKNLPIIFVAEDNDPTGQPIPTSHEKNEPGETVSYGFPVIPVDANDVVAVYRVACESIERVRAGGAPVLVDAKPYRLSSEAKRGAANHVGHPGNDDPLTHMERYLKAKGLFTTRFRDQVVQEFSQQLDTALKHARKTYASAVEKA